MQQTREELLRLAFECLRRAARLLDAAGDDLLVINGEERRAPGRRKGSVPVRRSKTSLPVATSLTGSGSIRPGDASNAGRRYCCAGRRYFLALVLPWSTHVGPKVVASRSKGLA